MEGAGVCMSDDGQSPEHVLAVVKLKTHMLSTHIIGLIIGRQVMLPTGTVLSNKV